MRLVEGIVEITQTSHNEIELGSPWRDFVAAPVASSLPLSQQPRPILQSRRNSLPPAFPR